MSSTTSRVSLYKPAGGENVNVTTDLNNNYDKIDTNLNFRVVANAVARNAISPFWAGLNVRETDTGKLYVSNGSAPISGSWKQIPVADSSFDADLEMAAGKQINIGAVNSSANLAVQNSLVGDDFLTARISGDSQSRYLVNSDGSTWWGSGSGSQDTNLYRDSASVLATDDEFLIKGGNLLLASGGTAEKNAQPSTSISVASSTTETVIATYSIPANDPTAGAVYKITAWGIASVNTATTPVITFRPRMGGVAGVSNATIPITAASGVTNKAWKAELYVSILTTGGSGTWSGLLTVNEGISVTGATSIPNGVTRMDGSSTQTIDTTTSTDMVITVQWGTSHANNTVTCRGFAAERIA